jgi:hypothetical protein
VLGLWIGVKKKRGGGEGVFIVEGYYNFSEKAVDVR